MRSLTNSEGKVEDKIVRFGRRDGAFALSLRDLVAPIFLHRRLAAMSFVAIFLLAILLAVFLPTQYEAEMKILVKRERVDPTVTSDKTTLIEPRPEVAEEELQSEVELLKSRDLLESVVTACGLDSHGKQVKVEEPGTKALTSRAKAVRTLEGSLQVQPIRKTNLIVATYKSRDPVLASEVLNTLANLYMEKHLAVHRLPGTLHFFQEQAEKYRSDLNTTEMQLTSFDRQAGLMSPDLEKEITVRKAGDFEGTLEQTRTDIAETTQRIAALEVQLNRISPRVTTQMKSLGNPMLLEQLKSTLLNLELRHTELLSKFAENYPPVQEVDKEIAQAQSSIADAERAPMHEETTDRDPTFAWLEEELARNRTELIALRARERALDYVLQTYHAKARNLEEKGATEQDLVRANKAAEENYLLYRQKQEEARISDALDRDRIVNVAIAEAATVPVLPTHSAWFVVLFGGLLAMLLSVGLAFGADYLDPSFRTPQELHNTLQIPVLAAVPRQIAR